MKKSKRAISMICAALIAVSSTPAVSAQTPGARPEPYTAHSQDISPRFSYLNSVFTDCWFENGKIGYYGDYTIMEGKKVTVTIILQKSSNGSSGWTDVKTTSKTYAAVDSGIHNSLSASYTNYSAGYYYRCKSVVSPLSSSGKPLETAIVYSEVLQISKSGFQAVRIPGTGYQLVS